ERVVAQTRQRSWGLKECAPAEEVRLAMSPGTTRSRSDNQHARPVRARSFDFRLHEMAGGVTRVTGIGGREDQAPRLHDSAGSSPRASNSASPYSESSLPRRYRYWNV